MTTTLETNGFGYEEPSALSVVQESLECVQRIQERVSRRTTVLHEILQRFGESGGRMMGLGERERALKCTSSLHEKRRLLPMVEKLKRKLLKQEFLRGASATAKAHYQRMADECAVLAFGTDFPLLVLPVLMEERLVGKC